MYGTVLGRCMAASSSDRHAKKDEGPWGCSRCPGGRKDCRRGRGAVRI